MRGGHVPCEKGIKFLNIIKMNMRLERDKLSGLIVSEYSEFKWSGVGYTKSKTPIPQI
jgi:hypothetical protein